MSPRKSRENGWSALCSVRSSPHDNGYAHPVDNIVAVVDLNRKQLVRFEDHGVIPVPRRDGNWSSQYLEGSRKDLKPLAVSQPEGTSFSGEGRAVTWQKWSFRVGFNPREWLVQYTIAYDGRPIVYRASIAEMIVLYTDPKASSYHKSVFEMGEYGVGMLANSLRLGCDCLGNIH
jgi:primary-amine oxidase